MATYSMAGAPNTDDDAELIYATHPAQPGTSIVYIETDGETSITDVVAWGILVDGTAVPITTSGVWDGVTNSNSVVQHPSGRCSKYEQIWDTLDEAKADYMSSMKSADAT